MDEAPRKINVMFSIGSLHNGGAERVIATLCDHIDQSRFNISVCWWLGNGAIGEELEAKGVELIGLRELAPDVSPYLRFRILQKLCRERCIDVLHTHDTGTLADAAQARLFGSRTRIVHTFHFGNYPNLPKRYLAMEFIFSRLAHYLIAVGHNQAKRIRRALRLKSPKLRILPNGVERANVESGDGIDLDIPSGDDPTVVLGSISTLTRQKGLPVLLEAAARLKNMQKNFILLIIGDGPMRPELEHQSRSLGVSDQVRFLGWIPNAARTVLHTFDIFCQASLWEANSIVLLEAMSAGLPAVTTDVGESASLIDDRSDGCVVPVNDAEALARAIAGLIDDKQMRQSFGKLAQQKFERHHTVDKMVSAYESVYAELAGIGR